MSFKLLNLYLKMGRFLAITPPSFHTHVQTKWRRWYRYLIMFLIVVSVGVSLYYKNFYLEYNLAKTTVCLLTDCALCAFCCRVIVEAGHVEKWRQLVDDLSSPSCVVEENGKKKKEENCVLKFLVPQVIFWIATTYITQYWTTILGVLYLKQSSIEIVQTHIQFSYTLYVYTILEMVRQRYAALTRKIAKECFKSKAFVTQMSYCVQTLKHLVNTFNSNFGWSLVLLVSFTTLQFLNYLEYNLQSHQYGQENITQTVITQVLAIFISFVPTVMVILKCDKIVEEAEEIVLLVSKSNLEGSEDLDRFGSTLQTSLPYFSAARFFPIGRPTILGIFGTVATFLIVLVTFDSGAKSDDGHGVAATNLSLTIN